MADVDHIECEGENDYSNKKSKVKRVIKFTVNRLRKELSNKPEIFHYVLHLKTCLVKRKKVLAKLKYKLNEIAKFKSTQDASVQTIETQSSDSNSHETEKNDSVKDWNVELAKDDAEKGTDNLSIADQVKEAAESALQQTGMVYDATSGMYYDYNTGYYYSAELGLYYHRTTGCYYYFDKEQNQFVFHSQPEISHEVYQRGHEDTSRHSSREKRKHKKEGRSRKRVRRRTSSEEECDVPVRKSKKNKKSKQMTDNKTHKTNKSNDKDSHKKKKSKIPKNNVSESSKAPLEHQSDALEDGECSSSDSELSSNTSSSESDESIASSHPPCMRIIVQETSSGKLKIGSLFLLTKDGGTLGREGSLHSIVIPEENVSRHHLTFSYDIDKHMYLITDMGSRNGTLLNGKRMSAAQMESEPMEIIHGSLIQLGGTKLLCHIHNGNTTCGHCEPGLLIRDSPPAVKTKKYKSVNLKKEHKREIQRLKTKYKIVPNKPGEGEEIQMPDGYEDKARKRREEVGSIHHGAKTEQASLDTSISTSNKGFKMLQKMGWQAGEGLGKEAKGNQEPVPLISNVGTMGLGCEASSTDIAIATGANTKKDKAKTNMWLATQKRFNMLPTPKAFAEDEDSDLDEQTAQ